jgi:4-hydroxy-3-methylbut-2-enyl diphosphate reductase
LVTKVHMEVTRASRKGVECILIGHAGHPEVEGTMGQYDNEAGGIYLVESVEDVERLVVKNPAELCFSSQTTLSVDDTADVIDALRKKFPDIEGPRKDDICYATQNRQDAVRELAAKVQLLLVVGAKNSSNSNRLRELAEKMGCTAYLIDTAADIQQLWLDDVKAVGVTAGASAPEVLVQQVVQQLTAWGGKQVIEHPGREENVVFAVPAELR